MFVPCGNAPNQSSTKMSSERLAGPGALPHDGVHVRLGRSGIHGIGVFSCEKIAAGTNVFASDQREIRWVSASILKDPSIEEFQRAFYEDFAIRHGDQLGCPSNFNLLTAGWYVNEPAPDSEPNLTATENFDLVAIRDIESGEELTVRYSSFSQGVRALKAERTITG